VTLPAGQVSLDWAASWAGRASGWRDVRARLAAQVARYVELAAGAGLRLALEIMPFSVLGGLRGFLDLCREVGSPALGLNFDCGHAWACRELVPAVPFELAGRIFGTHLGDNLSTENVKRPPGDGSVPFGPLLRNLRAAGYAGSFDLEIGCPAERVEEEYARGLAYLTALDTAQNGACA
jgi:sugar phosphate isomerase/epimerase